MFILNKTFKVVDNQVDSFLGWIKAEYLSTGIQSKRFEQYQINRLVSHQENDGTQAIIVQLKFQVYNADIDKFIQAFTKDLWNKFGTDALFFHSIMEEIENS